MNGQGLRYLLAAKYRSVDPVAGEIQRPIFISPPVVVNVADSVFVFATNDPKPVSVRVTAATGAVRGELKLVVPQEWEVSPASIPIDLRAADAETAATFSVKPPNQTGQWTLRTIVLNEGRVYSVDRERILFTHIGGQTLIAPTVPKLCLYGFIN